ncbi:MAG: leucyl aminopeptidase [Nocardioidaceae bacterium]|nr:MAG: leucyl aminopeptidase [Nocardioidaceae bacterium]
MTAYKLRVGDPDRTRADVVVVGATRALSEKASGRSKGVRLAPGAEAVTTAFGRKLAPLLQSLGVEGKPGEVTKIPTNGVIKSPLLLVVGLGESVDAESVRRASGVAARAVSNAASVALALPADTAELVRAVTEGYILGGYEFTAYKSNRAAKAPVEVAVLSPIGRTVEAIAAAETAEVLAQARCLVRDWVNNPPGDFTPAKFADAVVTANKARKGRPRVSVKVFDETALAERGTGGILGVGRGSASPPRLVRLTYNPAGAKAHLALVGKGITYDSGGLSIKPAASMTTMKMDMAGAAAVVAATLSIADLGLPIQVTAFAPMAENMISGNATRPGDVLTMYGGKTVEVLNTDAEGRLVLADALGHAVESKPDAIIDVATLTGACIMALGDRVTGLMGNDDDLIDQVSAAAAQAGEMAWHLPIPDEMTEKVRSNSKVADLAQHNSERWGGALYAAAFLQEFVGDLPWAHLDIAGPAYNEKAAYGYTPSGGTGAMVATLVELATRMAESAG